MTFLKAIELAIKEDLIKSLAIEGLMLKQEVAKIYLIELIQQQEEEKCSMILI